MAAPCVREISIEAVDENRTLQDRGPQPRAAAGQPVRTLVVVEPRPKPEPRWDAARLWSIPKQS